MLIDKDQILYPSCTVGSKSANIICLVHCAKCLFSLFCSFYTLCSVLPVIRHSLIVAHYCCLLLFFDFCCLSSCIFWHFYIFLVLSSFLQYLHHSSSWSACHICSSSHLALTLPHCVTAVLAPHSHSSCFLCTFYYPYALSFHSYFVLAF